MSAPETVCPVCTLYLRPGITLKSHLNSHPKQKIIEALIVASGVTEDVKAESPEAQASGSGQSMVNPWTPSSNPAAGPWPTMQGNHVFIYQQSMSTTAPQPPNVLNLNPLSPQYVIPTVFNPLNQHQSMMPYVYQQQQVIMSSSGAMRALSFDQDAVEGAGPSSNPTIVEVSEEEPQAEVTEVEEAPAEEAVIEKGTSKEELIKFDEPVYDDNYEDQPEVAQWVDSKACQTSEAPSPQKFYFVNEGAEPFPVQSQSNNEAVVFPSPTPPLNTNSNHIDYVEMDGMHVLIGDFSNNTPIINQVENFEPQEERSVLMTIGDLGQDNSESSHHVNIRTDERMPPRGELSGQESIGGASDITWNRMQYHEGSSGMSASYDLLARESWEASDSSDVDQSESRGEVPSFEEGVDDTPTIVSYTGPPLNFKCSTCGSDFASSKDRKDHEVEQHPEKLIKNVSGIKKSVKKINIGLKKKEPKSENNFDNVFTNKLKLETIELGQTELVGQVELVSKTDNTTSADVKAVCSICNLVFKSFKALRHHKIEVHKLDAKNKCGTCDETFSNDYSFTEHLKIHPLECRICGKFFFRRQNIQLHMKRHLGLKPYKCEFCHKSFVTKQKHDEHKNTHTGDAPIKCNLCDETFRRHSNLVQHRNRHHLKLRRKIRDYICYCGDIFHSKKKLAWHKEIHDAKPKSCTQCSEKFVHMSSLTRHMRRAHNENFLPSEERVGENVECPICKGIYLRSSLEIHIRNHSGARPFTCLICNKDFTTKWNLKLHKWTHASRTSKPFKCDQCKGAFIRESDYTAHMNSHKSVRPYTCNYCGAQFIRKYNCQRHVKEHENNKMFKCQVCGKSFHRSYYLKDHMRVHSGIRPFSCHICGKTSSTKSNHNKHVQIHHAREPVSTEN